MSSNYILKIGNKYRYRRRVPKVVAHLDKRKEVKISLNTSDIKIARIRADIYNEQIEAFWRSLVGAEGMNFFDEKYLLAVQLAKSYGYAYKTPEQIASSTLTEVIDRIKLVEVDESKQPKKESTEALLGGIDKPKILLSHCWEIFESLINDRLAEKSDDQIRKWKNVRRSAINNFIKTSSVQYLHEVNRSEILKFWDWLNEKIQLGYKANTANKQLSNLKDVLRTVSTKNEINLNVATLFSETAFREISTSRPPFESEFVQEKLIPAVMKLNDRDCYGFWAIADTGMRQSELFGLHPENDIFLDVEIPYIWIRPRKGYTLKTPVSERKIPLVGTALAAFKRFPNGFSNLGSAANFSVSINEFLTTNNLRPSPDHTAYSLRHTFKDRLRDYGEVGAPEEIIDELMGHKKPGVHYGRGHKLDTKWSILKSIAYSVVPNS